MFEMTSEIEDFALETYYRRLTFLRESKSITKNKVFRQNIDEILAFFKSYNSQYWILLYVGTYTLTVSVDTI